MLTLHEPQGQDGLETIEVDGSLRQARKCPLVVALHVTAREFLPSILSEGLRPSIGALSQAIESVPAVYLFPSWQDMEDASWLFEDWPHASKPALLAVGVEGLPLRVEKDAAFEVVCAQTIGAERIAVLFDGEDGWKPDRFVALGGLMSCQHLSGSLGDEAMPLEAEFAASPSP